jgi:peroxiredoxin
MPLFSSGVIKLVGADEFNPLRPGDEALGFTRQNWDGSKVSLSDYSGRRVCLVMLNALSNGASRRKLQNLTLIADSVQGAGYDLIAVTESSRSYNAELIKPSDPDQPPLVENLTFPVLDDEAFSNEITTTYAKRVDDYTHYPVVFVGADGRIEKFVSNEFLLDENQLEDFLDIEPLPETPPVDPPPPPQAEDPAQNRPPTIPTPPPPPPTAPGVSTP